MRASVVGLEIGTHAVRAAEISAGRDMPTLGRFGQVALPLGAVRDGEVVEPDIVAASLRRLWDEAGFGSRTVVVGVGNQRVIVRQADLPAMSEQDLRSALKFQAQELIPIPIEDAILDFQILEEFVGSDQEPMMRVLLVAAQKEMVGSLLAALEGANLRPSSVDLVPFALMRAVVGTGVHFDPDAPAAEAIVSIGAGVTNVIVHEQGVPRFVRMLIVGGDDVTQEIANRLSVDFETAEDLKRRADPHSADDLEVQAARIVEERVTPMLEEIRGSLDYYLAQSEAAHVGRILISGGGSLLRDLPQRLEEVLGIPVELGHPLMGVHVGRTGIAEGRLIEAEPLVAVPMGLALGALPGDSRTRRLSLLPTEVAESHAQRRQMIAVGAGVAGLAVLLGLAWTSQAPRVAAEHRKVVAAQAQTATLRQKVAALQGATALDAQVTARQKLVSAALQSDIDWNRLLREIATAMPNDTWLTSFTANSAGSVSLGAEGFDHTSAARFLLRMQDLPSLQTVWLPNSTKAKADAGSVSTDTFNATAKLTPKAESDRLARLLQDDQ